ncbi:hypothetical protein HPP92_027647 [Vanilla planifolia]|uniref:Uncharacterized protein n=1 Tax=Vanilla planifolia TaxID=51239 RepID=A0A835U7B5_VANPL|nr:hypothetical protein HPP92_027647 [Vanilla planifolia]
MGNSLSADFCEDKTNSFEEVNSAFEYERRRCKELEAIISKLKGDDLYGLDIKALEDLQSFHVEALSKICQEKLTNRISKPQEDGVFN